MLRVPEDEAAWIARLRPDQCSCVYEVLFESIAGEPTWGLYLVSRDRRCLIHGKPRHKLRAPK